MIGRPPHILLVLHGNTRKREQRGYRGCGVCERARRSRWEDAQVDPREATRYRVTFLHAYTGEKRVIRLDGKPPQGARLLSSQSTGQTTSGLVSAVFYRCFLLAQPRRFGLVTSTCARPPPLTTAGCTAVWDGRTSADKRRR